MRYRKGIDASIQMKMSGFFHRLTKLLFSAALALVALALVALAPSDMADIDQPSSDSVPKKASKAVIADFKVNIEHHQVLMTFRLANAFDKNLKRRLESGLPTSLVFDFALVRKRRIWFNKTVASGQLQVSAMYNAVSREYLVNYKHDGDLIESKLLRDPEELYVAMSEFEKLAVLSVEGQEGGLVARVRAELGTGSLLFFIPTRRTTEWVEKDIHVEREVITEE